MMNDLTSQFAALTDTRIHFVHARCCYCFSYTNLIVTMSVANHAKHGLVQALAPIITAVGLETQFAYPKKGNWTYRSAFRTIGRK